MSREAPAVRVDARARRSSEGAGVSDAREEVRASFASEKRCADATHDLFGIFCRLPALPVSRSCYLFITARIASHLHESNDLGSFRARGRARARGMLAEALAEAVASAVLRRYASLPKNGKPQPGEYTLLAGFAVTDDAVPDAPPRVVALGTGTKCLPASSRCPRGEALSDSHAEVIARRAFVRFLYDEFERAMEVDEGDAVEDAAARDETKTNATSPRSIVEYLRGASSTTPFRLRGGVRVHLYASQSPCGDASIFTLASGSRRDAVPSPRARCPSPSTEPFGGTKDAARVANTPPDVRETTKKSKRAKTSGGGSSASFAGATGAKRIVVVDKEHGVDFGSPFGALAVDNEHGVLGQTLGACRLKPGRGARTDCMSCSDKIARWVALGAQGALPSSLMRPTQSTRNASVFHDPAEHFERDREGSGGTNQALSSFETIRSYGAVRLASVVVSAPDDASAATGTEKENVLAALRRALVDRVPGDVPGDVHPKPGVFVVPPAPPELSSSAGQRRGWVASGTSVNWYWRRDEKKTRERGEARRDANDSEEKKDAAFSFLETEVTLGGTGRRAGFSKKARSSKKAQSRLCRASLAARYGEVVEKVRARREARNATCSAEVGGDFKILGTRRAYGALFADEKDGDGATTLSSREMTYETLKRLCSAAYAERARAFLAAPSPFARWTAKHPELGRTFKVFTDGS